MNKKLVIKRKFGFTLIEVLVVVCMLVILLSMGIFTSLGSYKRYALEAEKEKLISILFKARSDAMNNIGGKSRGIHIGTDSYILFSGEFDPGDLSQEKIERDSAIDLSGIDEIIFENVSGDPNILGSITLKNDIRIEDINIENEGKIDW